MAERRIRRRRSDRHVGPHEQLARDNLRMVLYCHQCEHVDGRLHDPVAELKGAYAHGEPYLDDSCETCWRTLAAESFRILRVIPPPS